MEEHIITGCPFQFPSNDRRGVMKDLMEGNLGVVSFSNDDTYLFHKAPMVNNSGALLGNCSDNLFDEDSYRHPRIARSWNEINRLLRRRTVAKTKPIRVTVKQMLIYRPGFGSFLFRIPEGHYREILSCDTGVLELHTQYEITHFKTEFYLVLSKRFNRTIRTKPDFRSEFIVKCKLYGWTDTQIEAVISSAVKGLKGVVFLSYQHSDRYTF